MKLALGTVNRVTLAAIPVEKEGVMEVRERVNGCERGGGIMEVREGVMEVREGGVMEVRGRGLWR